MPGIFKNIFDISKNKIYKIQQEEKKWKLDLSDVEIWLPR